VRVGRLAFGSSAASVALLVAAGAPRAQDAVDAVARLLLHAATPATADVDAVAAELVAGAAEHGRSPAAATLLVACRTLVFSLRDPAAFAGATRELVARQDLHGLTLAAAARACADALQRVGRDDEARALLAAGAPRAVLVLGPFGDEGDHYLAQPFAPELGLEHCETLAGRYGPVHPRVARFDPELRNGGYSLRDPRTGRVGCFYALHQPSLERATACYLELYAPGSFAVFVNGRAVGSFNGYAHPYSDYHWLPIVLRQGVNHVLVKTALNGFDRVALRYVDGAGRTIAWRDSGDPSRIEAVGPAGDELPPPPPQFVTPVLALDRAARAAAGAAGADALHLAAAIAAAAGSDAPLVLEHVLAVEAAPPQDLDLRLALVRAYDDATLLPEELRRSKARAILDGCGDAVLTHAWATAQRAQHLADEDKYEDAIRLLQAAVEARRAGPATLAMLHGFYEKLEFRAEATRLRRHWLEAYPADARAALAEAEERQRDGDTLGARDVLVAARRVAQGDARLGQRLLALAVDQEDAELALAVHADLYRSEPEGVEALRSLAEVQTRLGRAAAAARTWQQLAAHAEASARDLVSAGNALLAADADPEGMAALAAAVALDPSQHASRLLLRRLTGGEGDDHPALSVFRRDAEAMVAAFQPGANEQGAPSTLVLDQMIVQLHADGSAIEETHQLRRINDLSGVDKYQDAKDAARADEVVTLRTIAADGRSFLPHRVSGSFSMPRLAPGTFVEQVYRRHLDAPGADPWRGPEFHFQSLDEPYVLSELVLIVPKDAPGSFRVRNFDGSPEVRTLADGSVAHVYTKHDVPRLTRERLAPPAEEILPLVAYGEDRSVGASARRAHDYFLYRTRSSPLIVAKARELTAGQDAPLERLASIHAFVQGSIPTSRGAADPTAVLLRRQGPRFWLEVALLRAAGVPLQLATVARTPLALDDQALPLFSGDTTYGVDAVRIDDGGDGIWLFQDDPRHWPLGRIAAERLGAPALLLDERGWSPGEVGGSAAPTGVSVRGEVVLDERGTATFTIHGTLRGRDGFGVADQLREREDNIKKMAARQVAAQVLEGWMPRAIDLVLADTTKPLGLEGVLVKRQAVVDAGGVGLLDLPLGRRTWLQDLGDRGDRKQPLALTAIAAQTWEVAIDPGAAYRLVEVPKDVLVQHPLVEYAQTFRLVDGKLVVQRQWQQRPGRLSAAMFDEWLDLLRKLDLAEEVKVKLGPR